MFLSRPKSNLGIQGVSSFGLKGLEKGIETTKTHEIRALLWVLDNQAWNIFGETVIALNPKP